MFRVSILFTCRMDGQSILVLDKQRQKDQSDLYFVRPYALASVITVISQSITFSSSEQLKDHADGEQVRPTSKYRARKGFALIVPL